MFYICAAISTQSRSKCQNVLHFFVFQYRTEHDQVICMARYQLILTYWFMHTFACGLQFKMLTTFTQSSKEQQRIYFISCTLFEVMYKKCFTSVLQYWLCQDPSVKMYYIFLFSNIEQNMTKVFEQPSPTNIDLLVHAQVCLCFTI